MSATLRLPGLDKQRISLLASASPEVIIGAIATAIEGIRLGGGGVIVPHLPPLKVAEGVHGFVGAASGASRFWSPAAHPAPIR